MVFWCSISTGTIPLKHIIFGSEKVYSRWANPSNHIPTKLQSYYMDKKVTDILSLTLMHRATKCLQLLENYNFMVKSMIMFGQNWQRLLRKDQQQLKLLVQVVGKSVIKSSLAQHIPDRHRMKRLQSLQSAEELSQLPLNWSMNIMEMPMLLLTRMVQ